jgi:hypothetical protein
MFQTLNRRSKSKFKMEIDKEIDELYLAGDVLSAYYGSN